MYKYSQNVHMYLCVKKHNVKEGKILCKKQVLK